LFGRLVRGSLSASCSKSRAVTARSVMSWITVNVVTTRNGFLLAWAFAQS